MEKDQLTSCDEFDLNDNEFRKPNGHKMLEWWTKYTRWTLSMNVCLDKIIYHTRWIYAAYMSNCLWPSDKDTDCTASLFIILVYPMI